MTFDDRTIAKFWSKVKKGKKTECWIWIGGMFSIGYGNIYIWDSKKKRCDAVGAHRFSVMLTGRKIQKNREVDHLCRVPACINPNHLEVVTHKVNMDRARIAKGAPSANHCLHGHKYTKGNLFPQIRNGRKVRQCRQCQRDRNNAAYQRRKLRNK